MSRKRLSIVAAILLCVVLLIVDAQFEQGILNVIVKKTTIEKIDHNEESPVKKLKKKKVTKPVSTAKIEKQETDLHKEPYIIMLDPGHQEYGNYDEEPIGPGASETKPKVASGTAGVVTKKPEYELTLEVSLQLQEVLEEKGFIVYLTRDSHQVDISNVERAQMANEKEVDLVLRIHADGAESAEASGFSVLTPGPDSPYTEGISDDSLLAAEKILQHVGGEIPLHSNGLSYRNGLTGFNWSEVPVILVELGFMTNPEEDKKLSDPTYTSELTNLIADGVAAYKEEQEN